MVCHVPQWERNGRIIFVTTTDSKVQRTRVNEILDVIGEDLGFVASELTPQSIVSFSGTITLFQYSINFLYNCRFT